MSISDLDSRESRAAIQVATRRLGTETVLSVSDWPDPAAPYRVYSSNSVRFTLRRRHEEESDFASTRWRPEDLRALHRTLGGRAFSTATGRSKGRVLYVVGKCGLPIEDQTMGFVCLHVPRSGPLSMRRLRIATDLIGSDARAAAVTLVAAARKVALSLQRTGGALDWELEPQELGWVGRVFPEFQPVARSMRGRTVRRYTPDYPVGAGP